MTRRWLAALGIGIAAVGLAVGGRAPGPRPVREGDRGATAAASAPTAASAPAAANEVRAASEAAVATAKAGGPVAALDAALAGDDDVAKIDAVEAVVRERAVASLPTLLAIDLAREPEAAPSVIHAVASLANASDASLRKKATLTLGRWLAEESNRHDPDAEGNVPNLVEALGAIGDADATAALIGALERGNLDLSVETLVVESLGKAKDARALEPVRRFVDRIAAIPPVDGIQEELRSEAIVAGNSAISALQGG